MLGYSIISLSDVYKELGEDKTKRILSEFSCPINIDVEQFIKFKAIEFEKQSIARTQLVYASYKTTNVLVAYYSLANKAVIIKKELLNAKWRKRMNRFSQSYYDKDYFLVSLPLIGQISKNFNNDYNTLITGDELLLLACNTVRSALSIIGGRFVYLECENKPKLIDFYFDNGFVEFGKRLIERDERNTMSGEVLMQMLKWLD